MLQFFSHGYIKILCCRSEYDKSVGSYWHLDNMFFTRNSEFVVKFAMFPGWSPRRKVQGQKLWFPINARSSSIIDRPRSANRVFPTHKRDRWAEIKFPSHERSAFAKDEIARGRRREEGAWKSELARALASSASSLLHLPRVHIRAAPVIDLARAERGGGNPTTVCQRELCGAFTAAGGWVVRMTANSRAVKRQLLI